MGVNVCVCDLHVSVVSVRVCVCVYVSRVCHLVWFYVHVFVCVCVELVRVCLRSKERPYTDPRSVREQTGLPPTLIRGSVSSVPSSLWTRPNVSSIDAGRGTHSHHVFSSRNRRGTWAEDREGCWVGVTSETSDTVTLQ